MSFTVTIGWWLAPLVITVAAYAWAFWERSDEFRGGIGNFADGFVLLLRLAASTCAALAAWLVWALAR